ncbi:MAG TPA: PIG-L deacetylase family protein [Steroidobacteraceae bacterium]
MASIRAWPRDNKHHREILLVGRLPRAPPPAAPSSYAFERFSPTDAALDDGEITFNVLAATIGKCLVFNYNGIPQRRPRLFDSRDLGTADSYWQAELASAPAWPLPEGPVVVVAAHPDDETFGAGGLIHSCSRAGHEVTVITVTDGEGARTDLEHPGTVRRRELRAALSCLSGRTIQWYRLGMPDGYVISHESAVERAIKTRLPTDATLIAPVEQDGHPDHETVARICMTLGHRRNMSVLRYPIWAWHHSSPGAWREGEFVRFELSAEAQMAKSRAIRCFASQLDAGGSHAVMPTHVLSYFSRPYEAFLR